MGDVCVYACIDLKINLHFSLMIDLYVITSLLSKFSQCLALLKNAIYFFLHIAYKIFTVSIEHLFPFNWSFWLFVVGMAAVGLCELSWNQRYWISRL